MASFGRLPETADASSPQQRALLRVQVDSRMALAAIEWIAVQYRAASPGHVSNKYRSTDAQEGSQSACISSQWNGKGRHQPRGATLRL